EVLHNWEVIKRQERDRRGEADAKVTASALDGVPRSLPALARAQALGARAGRFDYADNADAPAKLAECLAWLEQEMLPRDAVEREEALGQVLLALVGLARRLEVDAESALRAAVDHFTARFTAWEQTHQEA
ncbi:MAG: nucleoside triphosphate pyrophosphohydrolase, partial [Anaerolineae bacterium]